MKYSFFRKSALCSLLVVLVGCSSRLESTIQSNHVAPLLYQGVNTGADRLANGEYHGWIKDKKVAVLAHAASRLKDGTHLVDRLHDSKLADIKMIFAPEHGFRTEKDAPVPDYQDPKTGVMVYSLYGPRKAPTEDLLSQVDVIVVDLQDVGVRFYTYVATVTLTLQAAAKAGKPVIILDRPNPIGGTEVSGPLLEPELVGGITAFHPIPLLHGMTMGEIVSLYNTQYHYNAELKVIPMIGWERSMFWSDTGLTWFAPSPALPSFEQALLYSWLGTLEALPLAVGRGIVNDEAFRVFGAPWISEIDALLLLDRLNAAKLPGLRFSTVSWIPTRSAFEEKLCNGFRVEIVDAHSVQGLKSLLTVMTELHAMFGNKIKLDDANKAIGAKWVMELLKKKTSIEQIETQVEDGIKEFRQVREKFLLY